MLDGLVKSHPETMFVIDQEGQEGTKLKILYIFIFLRALRALRGENQTFYPIVAKVGGLQSQGVNGAAVVGYRKPLTTQDLEPSGFPVG